MLKSLTVKFLVPIIVAFFLSYSQAAANTITCDTYQLNGGDEAFLMNLNTPLKWGDTVYDGNIYVSPKGTVTFGQGDYTYWAYPSTPSISIAAYDYHAFANNNFWGTGNDLYIKYGSSSTHVCVDWKIMLWGQSSGEPVYIRMIAYVNPETYEWTPTYQVSNNAPSDARYGARYEYNGEVFPLEIQFVSEPPSPEPTLEPTPEPTISPEESEEQVEPESPETDTESPVDTESPEAPLEPSEPVSEPSVEPLPPVVNPAPRPVPDQNLDPEPAPKKSKQPVQEQLEEVEQEIDFVITSDEPTPIIEIIEKTIISENIVLDNVIVLNVGIV